MGKRQSRLRPEEIEELVEKTHFTPKELNRWYRGFLRDCPTGTLTEQEFCKIYARFFPFGDTEPLASLMFRGFGGGGGEGGVVGFAEFITALSAATRGSTEERLALLFKLYDTDGDGCVGRGDVERVMEAMHKMVGPLLAQQEEEEKEEEEESGEMVETAGGNRPNRVSVAASSRVKEICRVLNKEEEEEEEEEENLVDFEQFSAAVKLDPEMTRSLQHQQQLLI